MSVQRWDDNGPSPFGMYVLFTDHERAVAEAREDERGKRHDQKCLCGDCEYSEGHADALNDAVDAVKALPDWKFCDAVCGTERSAVAAIEALRGES